MKVEAHSRCGANRESCTAAGGGPGVKAIMIMMTTMAITTPDLAPRVTVPGNPNASSSGTDLNFDPSALGVPSIYPAADGTGPRNFVDGKGTFTNNLTLIKAFKFKERYSFELKASAYNAFNQVRRTSVNNSVQYKANGATFADGFRVYNTPDQVQARLAATGVTDPLQLHNM